MNFLLRASRSTLLLALLLSAAAAPAHAQERGGPVEVLLRQRAELGLSERQVARLEAVRRTMEERNRPLVAELVRIRRELRDGPRRGRRGRVEEARPLMQQIRRNNREAMVEVGEILTADQKAWLREALRHRRERHGDRFERRDRGG